MSAALFPEPEGPAGSGLPGGGWDAGDGIPQGLYVTAPAEDLTLEGFVQDGRADTMAPGPLLAMVLDTAAGPDGAGLAGLSDDQLVGFLSGTRRMESRLAWARMAALAEFASRPRRQDFAADEVAAAFHLTWLSAAGEVGFAQEVARRLPVTFAALAAGKLHPVHVKIIEDVTSILSDEDAAIADEILAGMAASKTYARATPGREPAGAQARPRGGAEAEGEGAAGGAGAGVPGGVRERRDHRPGVAQRGSPGLDAACRGPRPRPARGRGGRGRGRS